jgi:hypothetical protein
MFLFGGPIAAIIVWRVLAHAERMEMLRRGITPPLDPRAMRRAMKYGWQPGPMPPPGPGPIPGPMPGPIPTANPYGYDPLYQAQHQLRRGMQVAFVGLALLIGLSFLHGGGAPHGPWLLAGLIPLFVGIAQVITAIMGGAQFGIPRGTQQTFGPPPGPGAAPPPGPGPTAAQAPSGPYAWRPGPTPEIEKPASPPDYR